MKCGKGHVHASVAEVAECYGVQVDSDGRTVATKATAEYAYDYLSSEQQIYLNDLLRQFHAILVDGLGAHNIDYKRGKNALDGLIDARRLKAAGKPWSLPQYVLNDPRPRPKEDKRTPTKRNKK